MEPLHIATYNKEKVGTLVDQEKIWLICVVKEPYSFTWQWESAVGMKYKAWEQYYLGKNPQEWFATDAGMHNLHVSEAWR